MALPYPEGEVYFLTEALKLTSDGYTFDASDSKSFYQHCLVETVWNRAVTSRNSKPYNNDNMPKHKRSKLNHNYGSYWNQRFGIWDTCHVMFGDKAVEDKTTEPKVNRHVVCDLNQDWGEIRRFNEGGSRKVEFRPVKLGDGDFMYIDLTMRIRAIYFPLAHKASAVNEDLCTYLMIDFRMRDGASFRSPGMGTRTWRDFDDSDGLERTDFETLCFDIPGIYKYLCVPRQMRNPEKGLYHPAKDGDELITLWSSDKLPATPNDHETSKFSKDIDFASILRDNFGVEVVYQPIEYDAWAGDFVEHIAYLGLGYIPKAGPLLAVCFTVSMQLIKDPEAFKNQNPLNLTSDVLSGCLAAALEMRSNVHPNVLKA